jgi:Zn-dependent peptidase ImmA (M78 family)
MRTGVDREKVRGLRYSPWEDLGRREVALRFDVLPEDQDGLWLPDLALIVLDRRLTQTERRCSLAHELVHHELGHVECGHAGLAEIQESQADAMAARRLVTIDQLAAALPWTVDKAELADMLWVTEDVLELRLGLLSNRDRALLDARMALSQDLLGADLGEQDLRARLRAATLNPQMPSFSWPPEPGCRVVVPFEESA